MLSYDQKEREIARAVVQGFKESNPCTDCGQKFPHYLMEFDHTEDPPRTNSGKRRPSILGHYAPTSVERILKILEKEKVELVCCTCHIIRHQSSRRGKWNLLVS